MNKGYRHQTSPLRIPRDDGKIIDEHFGLPSTGTSEISVARMIAPPGWSEPPQTPEFDEYVLIVRGSLKATVDGNVVTVRQGQSLRVESGATVVYENPSDTETEYWSLCLPAFHPSRAHIAE